MGMELAELLQLATASLSSFVKDIKEKGFSWGRLWVLVQEVVRVVEAISIQFNKEVAVAKLKGESKQDLAVRLLNYNVDIPFLPEFIETILFKFLIDQAVKQFNKAGIFTHEG